MPAQVVDRAEPDHALLQVGLDRAVGVERVRHALDDAGLENRDGLRARRGGPSRLEPRPAYQNGANSQPTRAVPDVSALADIVPGWPVVVNGTLQTAGGTSGSTPLIAAASALVSATQRKAGQPPIGLANGWFYQAASQGSTFVDVTQGSNDLAGIGCCQAMVGYDAASGLGVPKSATSGMTLPSAG